MIAQVAVDASTHRILNYLVPASLQGKAEAGFRVRVPLRSRLVLGTIIEISSEAEHFEGLRPIHEIIGSTPMIRPTLLALAQWVAEYYCAPLETILRCMLPSSLRGAEMTSRERRFLMLARSIEGEEIAHLQKVAPRQAQLLTTLLKAKKGKVAFQEVGLRGISELARGLERRGLVSIVKERVHRDPFAGEVFLPNDAPPLSGDQQRVLEVIIGSIRAPDRSPPLLLHGVTGSGKTEIYLGAICETLRLGRTAMVLVPEISLTPQTVERFKSRFASIQEEVIVIHSHLSEGERFDAWHKIHSGGARIVIGARSAIFVPLENLGLIVVDEEHENSYKQEEAPRYHARDLAVLRGSKEKCAVLLGSATPSLESYFNARKGKYRLLELRTRADDRSMPIIRILDLRRLKHHGGGNIILSPSLCVAIQERLARQEQVILFLNRRGFSTALVCAVCGHVCQCPDCSLSLTYHRVNARLVCHLCGHTAKIPERCPGCKDPTIRYSGIGTQKIEEISRQLFPNARIARMDADSMTRKNAHREVLGLFKSGQIDLLIGTQMIAKGLHFPNVTLVGVINADLGLHLPDFRAGERTFQLLTQVAGRAGRGEMQGEVFVQTFTPFSPAIQFARHHDYEGFFEQEIQFRECFGHPPFSRLMLLTIRAAHRERAEFSAQTLARKLKKVLPTSVIFGQPAPAPLEKVKGQFRFHLSLRVKSISKLVRLIRPVLEKMSFPEGVRLAIDVDPYQLL
ncbi:MAG: primosomal protein N' [Verrucomicrobia bacterium]|nr:MAG: primosomal protein N' [Verrucomicrobiota bacterium]